MRKRPGQSWRARGRGGELWKRDDGRGVMVGMNLLGVKCIALYDEVHSFVLVS